eukprot:COSAG05_NODE_1003_length_6237_cov_7.337732_3_plen_102_part_00
MDAEVVPALSRLADGDARAALNALELAVTAAQASSVPAGTATSPLPGSGATSALPASTATSASSSAAVEAPGCARVSVALVEKALQKTHVLYLPTHCTSPF